MIIETIAIFALIFPISASTAWGIRRDFEKKIIDLQIKEVESILSWIESNESSEDSDGYLHMKYSEKLKYLSQIQSNLRD